MQSHFPDYLVPLPKVKEITGLARSTIYARVAAGELPAPAKIGRAARWSARELEQYVSARLAERNSAAQAA
jgi:prophage regulatory protein